MKTFLLIAKYPSLVMGTVAAVEQSVDAPGQVKAQVALDTIQTISRIAARQYRRRTSN